MTNIWYIGASKSPAGFFCFINQRLAECRISMKDRIGIGCASFFNVLKKQQNFFQSFLLFQFIQLRHKVFCPQMRIPLEHLHGLVTTDGRYLLV